MDTLYIMAILLNHKSGNYFPHSFLFIPSPLQKFYSAWDELFIQLRSTKIYLTSRIFVDVVLLNEYYIKTWTIASIILQLLLSSILIPK